MKIGQKRIFYWFCGLLTVLMLAVILPIRVSAAKNGELVVNGVNILAAENYTVACGEGTAVYNPDTRELTLNNATLNENFSMGTYNLNRMIDNSTGGNLTIILVGNNSVGTNASWDTGYRINSDAGLTVKGEGTLTVQGGDACIFAQGKLTIDGATVTVHGNNDYGIASFRNEVIIQNGAKVTGDNCIVLVTDEDYGGNITISGSTVIATSNYNAIAAGNGSRDLIIKDSSSVEAKANDIYPALVGYNISITDSKVKAETAQSWGIYAPNDLIVTGKTELLSKGVGAALGSYGDFKIIPPTGGMLDVVAGSSEDDAAAISGSPLSKETDMNSIGTRNTYFYSCVHTHVYNQEIVDDAYKKADATCTEAAVYYKSCICGEIGTETFESGEPLGHSYGEPVFEWSEDGKTCTAIFTCIRDNSHIEKIEATVTSKVTKAASSTEKGITTYTASVTFEGKEYTASKAIEDIAALGNGADNGKSDDGTKIDRNSIKTKKANPETGDTQSIIFWMLLLVFAGVILTGTVIYTRKRNYKG